MNAHLKSAFHNLFATSLLLSSTMLPSTAMADAAAGADNKLSFSPVGTLLLDGALYASPEKPDFPDGVGIPEARLGVIAKYGKWSAKIEAGYSYNKVALKDCYFQYTLDEQNFFRAGAMINHFGYQSSTAACMKVTMIEPISNTVFGNGQLIGLQWFHSDPHIYSTVSAHAEPDATTLNTGITSLRQTGYGLRSRVAWHPFIADGKMLQIGVTGSFNSPQNNKSTGHHDSFTMSANFPTKVASVKAIGVTVDKAMNRWEVTPELMGAWHRVAIESQGYFSQTNRREGLQAFRGYGVYATLRGLLLGNDYSYNSSLGGIATPKPGSLELVATYNYTCLSDSKAGIRGGRLNDVAAVANYYINKWMVARLRYGYTWVRDREADGPHDLGAVQARLQIIF